MVFVLWVGLVEGCTSPSSPSVTPWSYQFSEMISEPSLPETTSPSDNFSCLGITDEQWKSMLRPGYFVYARTPCQLRYLGLETLTFDVWGIDDPMLTPDVAPGQAMWNSAYEPFLFYRFPTQFGVGGAWWGFISLSGYPGAMASPSYKAQLCVALIFGENPVTGEPSRGVSLELYRSEGTGNVTPFQGDMVSAMVQLVWWAAYGLAMQYPGWAPAGFPVENPLPYVPPADGSVPSATTTLAPVPPSIFSVPDASPSPSGGR